MKGDILGSVKGTGPVTVHPRRPLADYFVYYHQWRLLTSNARVGGGLPNRATYPRNQGRTIVVLEMLPG